LLKFQLANNCLRFIFGWLLITATGVLAQSAPRLIRFVDASTVNVSVDSQRANLHIGDHLADWTLMQIVDTDLSHAGRYAVFEDFNHLNGSLIVIEASGVELELSKTSEPTFSDPAKLYFGHTFQEVMDSPNAPTRWGRIGFAIKSQMDSMQITAEIKLPAGFEATTVLRLRAPDHAVLKSVMLNGRPWTSFDPKAETITIPASAGQSITVLAQY
jgi:hypothetical protein